MRILIVEDDELLGDGIRTVLLQGGSAVDWVRDGRSADRALQREAYDVAVLDLNLPLMSGFEVLERLRGGGSQVPVLVLTARWDIADRVKALDGGADDYLVKPFDVDELGARLRALHRRSQGYLAPKLQHGDLCLDPAARRVTVAGEPVALSTREFAVFQALLENRGRVMSRRRLEEALYGSDDPVDSNTVEVHIHHLRKKLGSRQIRTVRGVGYIIEPPK
jgi:DNA-binding response OmpR family regulator